MKRMILGYFLVTFCALVSLIMLVALVRPDFLYTMILHGTLFVGWFAFLGSEPGDVGPILASAGLYWSVILAAVSLLIAIPLARREYARTEGGSGWFGARR